MKVKNLYVGEIKSISNIEHVKNKKTLYEDSILTVKLERTTIFLMLDEEKTTVKDLLYGGKYNIKNPVMCGIYDEFATNLDQITISEILGDYPKKHISKRKVLQLYKDYCKNK